MKSFSRLIFLMFHLQILPFAHDLCLNLDKYDDPEHQHSCGKRHRFVDEDELQLCIEKFSIKFRILHFYSLVHYKVEIFAQKESDYSPWAFLNAQKKVVEVFFTAHYRNPSEFFQHIFKKINDPHERFECYEAKVFLKLKDVFFAEEIFMSKKNGNSFLQNISFDSAETRKIIDRLNRMAIEFRGVSDERALMRHHLIGASLFSNSFKQKN